MPKKVTRHFSALHIVINRHLVLPNSSTSSKTIENTRFFALFFSTHKGKGVMLHIGTTSRLFKLFSFIQWPIVGHISQIRFYIAVEDQIGVAHRVMGEQVVQL